GLLNPFFCLYLCLVPSSSKMHKILTIDQTGIYRYHNKLCPKCLRQIIDELRVAHCRRINGNLVCPTVEQYLRISQFIDSTTYGKRNIDLAGYSFDQINRRLTLFVRGRNIQKDQFIGTL